MESNLPETKEPTPVDRPDDALDRLARVMAKLCHGSIAVVCTPGSAVAMALRQQKLAFHLDDRALAALWSAYPKKTAYQNPSKRKPSPDGP